MRLTFAISCLNEANPACIGVAMIQEMSMHILIGYWMKLWCIEILDYECLLCRMVQLRFFWFCRKNLRDCAEKTSHRTDPQKLSRWAMLALPYRQWITHDRRQRLCLLRRSFFVGCHGPWDRYKGVKVHRTWHETKLSMFARPKGCKAPHGLHEPFHEVGWIRVPKIQTTWNAHKKKSRHRCW